MQDISPMGSASEARRVDWVRRFAFDSPALVSFPSVTMPAEEQFRVLRSAVAGFAPKMVADHRKRIVAAVAVVLRAGSGGIEALLIHRAVRTFDPWSGHMAFPGGRVESRDASSLNAAIRETREEIALDLERSGTRLGRLSDARPRGSGRRLGLVIEPFVFELEGDPMLQLSDEVQSVVWVPLGFLEDPVNRSSMWYRRAIVPVRLPCYRYHGHLIWGLTLRILDEIVELSDPSGRRRP